MVLINKIMHGPIGLSSEVSSRTRQLATQGFTVTKAGDPGRTAHSRLPSPSLRMQSRADPCTLPRVPRPSPGPRSRLSRVGAGSSPALCASRRRRPQRVVGRPPPPPPPAASGRSAAAPATHTCRPRRQPLTKARAAVVLCELFSFKIVNVSRNNMSIVQCVSRVLCRFSESYKSNIKLFSNLTEVDFDESEQIRLRYVPYNYLIFLGNRYSKEDMSGF